ncbi:MAG: pullulanase-type alpha-1,6-glucosidase [Deltaproteobacteria bacterium]|nr:pullulanase-type alpha-1,6-glucosidase [Deltaproteobacteria bacterium]
MMRARSAAVIAFHLALGAGALACGSEEPPPDGGLPGTGDAGSLDSGTVDLLVIHYHRPDRAYAGWILSVNGDTGASSLEAVRIDGFGAVYEVPLTPGAARVTYAFTRAGTSDPATPWEIDLDQASARAVWHFSGYSRPLYRAPPAIPGGDQVAIHYKRADDAYQGWGLHLWGDVVEETLWAFPKMPDGVDPDFGAYWLVDVEPNAARVNVIVHLGDTKDPGPDMGWDVAELGDIVFLRTRSTEISPFPVEIPAFAIDGAKAFWLDRRTLAWDFDDRPATRFEIRSSTAAEIHVVGTEVVGGEVEALTRDLAGLSSPLRARWPHLAASKALRLPATTTVAPMLRGQLVVVARDDQGAALAATQVQIPGVIDDLFTYDGPLGVTFAGRVPTIRVWAPTAQAMRLVRFAPDLTELETLEMTPSAQGVWSVAGTDGWYGSYYQYEVRVYHPATGGIETLRTTDPYSVSLSKNGRHTQIVDLDDPALKPPGWDGLAKPPLAAPEDVSIFELHVRDFSAWDETVPALHRGRFLAFIHNGVGGADESNGMRHLKALQAAGLNTIHLLPAFDFATVPEDPADRVEITDGFDRLCAKNAMVPTATCAMHGTTPIKNVLAGFDPISDDAQEVTTQLRSLDGFNWGYDPLHYTAPEGSYATDAQGSARILEFRQMVMALAQVGLRVALDVVYNHTNAAGVGENAVLDRLVPGYYHRLNTTTGFVEASTCCANTATEHAMMERLMIDSLVTWARAYKVDAFRFDLMGHHLKRNMIKARDALHALTSTTDGVEGGAIYLYGEGWDFGEVAGNARGQNATQANMAGTGVGTFNDRIRDAARGGSAFDSGSDLIVRQGFINGLYYDPNSQAPANDARKTALFTATDQLKVSLAGNLKAFRLVTRSGGVSPGSLVPYSGQPAGYTDDPQEAINYVSAHDNQTLFDINAYRAPAGTPMDARVRMQNLGVSLAALGQGVPFFHAGVELLRSKSMERDSYDAGDWFNRLDFTFTTNNWKVGLPRRDANGVSWPAMLTIFADPSIAPATAHIHRATEHFEELMRVRYSTALFRLRTGDEVKTRVDFLNGGPSQIPGLVVMTLTDGACAGADLDPQLDAAVVLVNATPGVQAFSVPGAAGFVLHPVLAASTDAVVRTATVSGQAFEVPPRTAAVFVAPQTGAQGAGLPCNTR